MDGLDCCYVDINIINNVMKYNIIKYNTIPFSEKIKKSISSIIGSDNEMKILDVNKELGVEFLNIVKDFINEEHVELICMHGQTITHIDKIKTRQIGDPKYLFDHYNIPVIYDFRTEDIFLGGNGAPLVPYLDWLLSQKNKESIFTINLGGIANITYIDKLSSRDKVIGFDTGPGMCLIDQYVQKHWGLDYDLNGEIAKNGKINNDLLNELLRHPFLQKKFPKSTSREEFDLNYIENIENKHIKINNLDFLRTLVNFTACSIYFNSKLLQYNNEKIMIIISGGGAKNPLLVNDIKKIFSVNQIFTSEYYGINIDIKEAFLMAVMGYSRYNNIDNNMPSVTGARIYASYGKIYE